MWTPTSTFMLSLLTSSMIGSSLFISLILLGISKSNSWQTLEMFDSKSISLSNSSSNQPMSLLTPSIMCQEEEVIYCI